MKIRVLSFLGMLMLAGSVTDAQKVRAVPDAESAHILKLAKTDRKLPSKVETDGAGKSASAASQDGKFKAYVLCVPPGSSETENCSVRVFVENLQTKEIYEVLGEELFVEVGRPVDELKWKNPYTLTYERWVGPHFGHRYVIDARTMKQTAAYTLTDQ